MYRSIKVTGFILCLYELNKDNKYTKLKITQFHLLFFKPCDMLSNHVSTNARNI